MAAKKKDLVQSPPLSRMADLIQRLQKSGVPVESASSAMSKWRYIDFVNPRARLPCLALEWQFGARGFLAGRILQLRATFSKGKSSFMYLQYAMAQMMANAFCLHIETEGAAAPADYVASFGCNPNDLMTIESQSLEDCLGRVDEVICQIRGGFGGSMSEAGRVLKTKYTDPLDPDKSCPIVIGIDSLSSLGKESEAALDVMDITETAQLSYHARKLREYFRNRVSRIRDTNTLMMLASHETAKIETGKAKGFGGGGGSGGDKSSIAQNAVGGHATWGVDVNSTPYYDKEKGRQVGDTISLYTFKNKISPRYRRIDLPLVWNEGFDLIKADWDFLSSHAASPFAPAQGEEKTLYKHSAGITCKALSSKSFKSEEEFLRALYGNTDFVMSLREKLRIRGCGFGFETQYLGKEIPNDLPEGHAGDLTLAGAPEPVPEESDAGR